jgi:hypothetical protein
MKMNKLKIVFYSCMALSICLLFAGISTGAETIPTDADQIRHIKTVLWPQAYREQDVKLLDRLLHPTFRLIDSDGQISSKQEELDYISKHKPSHLSFRFEIERLEVYEGKFAVVSGTGIIEDAGPQGKTETRYRSSNHLIKAAGRWQAISSHVSGVKTSPQHQ